MSERESSRYSARTGHLDAGVVENYEARRFSGVMGRYRMRREQRGVGAIVEMLPPNISILDCPCGIGRWWPVLARRANQIQAVDISPAMLDAAKKQATMMGTP